ncbi:hypothetical protein EU527_00240 [Candidatus Thorarchaeota archaeon]|nr:MAG: hypothetical protein EU527_00240 [Candidatus Thorarchaeota archaeon]
MLNDIIEGCFVISSDDLIFEVKGIMHPEDRIIAYVRYVPDVDGERRGFRKISNFYEREEYLKKNFPYYLWYSKTHGRVLQSVPREMVKISLNPVEYLDSMKKAMVKDDLSRATIELANKLEQIANIKKLDIGVTGSQLTGTIIESSDIDLVIYGSAACYRFYNRIQEMFDQIHDLKRYSGNLLDTHVRFRWRRLEEYHSILKKIEHEKLLQGIFEPYHFYIRLVKKPCDVKEEYGTITTKMRGFCEMNCVVKDVSQSIFTPCEYIVKSLEYPKIKKLVSYRGRFTEQASSGMLVRVRGRLEDVTNNCTGEIYQQIVMGECPTDFLLPI